MRFKQFCSTTWKDGGTVVMFHTHERFMQIEALLRLFQLTTELLLSTFSLNHEFHPILFEAYGTIYIYTL